MTISKDSQVEARQLEQKSLVFTANLEAASSDAPALLSIDNSTLSATVLTIDVKQLVAKCYKVQVTDRSSGQAKELAAAPSVADNQISVTVDATGLSDVCVEVIYKAQ